MIYEQKTDLEVKHLALDILSNRVFGTWSHPEAAKWCFMPLLLCGADEHAELKDANIVHVYEYLDKAGLSSINGLPSFMTMKLLDQADSLRLLHEVQRAEKMQAAFMADEPPPEAIV